MAAVGVEELCSGGNTRWAEESVQNEVLRNSSTSWLSLGGWSDIGDWEEIVRKTGRKRFLEIERMVNNESYYWRALVRWGLRLSDAFHYMEVTVDLETVLEGCAEKPGWSGSRRWVEVDWQGWVDKSKKLHCEQRRDSVSFVLGRLWPHTENTD